jgi:hypothetical protein
MATRTARKSAWLCDAITGLRSLVRNHYVMYATRVDPPVGRGAGCSRGCSPTGWPRRALDILVREAGGAFISLDGTAGPHGGSAVATNGLLHRQVLS